MYGLTGSVFGVGAAAAISRAGWLAPHRYVTQLYEQATEIEQAYASWQDARKRGNPELAKEIYEGEKSSTCGHPTLNGIAECCILASLMNAGGRDGSGETG